MNSNKSLSLGFEFLDIEIIDHKKEPGTSNEKWNCDECSLFFLSKEKLAEHKNKHSTTSEEALKCRYCSKKLSLKEESKECYANRKCNTCEYKCSKCPLRFQRHSSFVNHEKSHSLLKKKRSVVIKKKHIIEPKSQKVNSPSKTKHTREIVKEQQEEVKQIENNEHSTIIISPKKRKTLPEVPVLLNEKLEPNDSKEMVQTNDKITKQRVNTNKQTPEEKTVREKPNNNTHKNSVNNSSDSMVNYKPFSCHICFENFASGDSLLAHIQTHGESASKGFKCKHCGDEFDDIYKMQYHLAICPLAEDETVFVKSVPLKFHRTPSGGSSRKLTRPKKIIPNTSNEKYDDELTPSFRTRGSIKKRKKTEESSESDTESNSSKYPRRNKASKTEVSNLTNEFVDINACHKKSFDDDMEEDDVNISKNISNDPLNDSFETVEDDKPKVHSCPFPRCGIKFSREKALLCHMRNHNDDFEDSYKCHKCDIPFDDIHLLRSHLNECKDVKEEKEDEESEPEYTEDESTNKSFQKRRGNFICNVCGRTYLSQENMKRCLHDTVNDSETPTSCRLCGKLCDSEKTLRKHFRSSHSRRFPFQCSICHAEFDTKQAESEHFSNHLDSDNFQCIICFLNLPTYKDLYFHYKQDHVTKQQNICEICNKIVPKKHECNSEERHKCLFCHKVFSTPASMTMHLKRHTNKKIYKCKICYRAFIDTSDLMKHMLFHATITTEEKPYKCCLCLVAFKCKSHLSTHITESHIGKKLSQLVCPICDEMSESKTMMASHIMGHSMNVSKKKMTHVETKWIKQIEYNHNEKFSKRGRPKRLHTRKRHDEINSDSDNDELNFDNNVTKTLKDNLADGDISTVTKQQFQPQAQQIQACNDSVQEQCHTNNPSKRYNTRGANVKVDNGDVIDTSKKLKISIKSNVIQTATNVKKVAEIESSSQMDTESPHRNNIESRQRPMSFIKITSSYSKSNVKPSRKHRSGSAIIQKSKKSTLSESSLSIGKTNSCNGIANIKIEAEELDTTRKRIKIEDEELEMCPTSSTSAYSNSTKKRLHENETNVAPYTKSIIWEPEIKKEETECFIKEKKYYEPSLGLTKFSCTTCLLSFPTQNELLIHNTQHIL